MRKRLPPSRGIFRVEEFFHSLFVWLVVLPFGILPPEQLLSFKDAEGQECRGKRMSYTLTIALLGAIVVVAGVWRPVPNYWALFIGSNMLLIAAALDRMFGLTVLQAFLSFGSILGLLEKRLSEKIRQIGILVAGAVAALLVLGTLRINGVTDIKEWAFAVTQGAIIALLAYGYALVNTNAMFMAASGLSIWAACDAMIRGNTLAWVWVIINVAFAWLTRPGREQRPAQATT